MDDKALERLNRRALSSCNLIREWLKDYIDQTGRALYSPYHCYYHIDKIEKHIQYLNEIIDALSDDTEDSKDTDD